MCGAQLGGGGLGLIRLDRAGAGQRDGWCAPPITVEQHHLTGEGDLVAQHLTLHGTHRESTMPLLAETTVTGRQMAWTFIHIWRVCDGLIVEHWACRDDMGLLEQLRD